MQKNPRKTLKNYEKPLIHQKVLVNAENWHCLPKRNND